MQNYIYFLILRPRYWWLYFECDLFLGVIDAFYSVVGDLNFIKVLNDQMHLHVSKEDFKLEIYPDIKLKTNRVLYWFESHTWEEITEEEFLDVYYETKYLIEKIADIL